MPVLVLSNKHLDLNSDPSGVEEGFFSLGVALPGIGDLRSELWKDPEISDEVDKSSNGFGNDPV
jgi:hypothetical protein